MFSTCTPCAGVTPVSIHGGVINTGLFRLDSVDVEFVDGFGGMSIPLHPMPIPVANVEARGECVGGAVGATLPDVVFQDAGSHPITFRIDPWDAVPEYNESNNELMRSLFVYADCDYVPPDLEILSEYVNPSDLNLVNPETLQSVTVTVFNEGAGDATDVWVDVNVDGVPLCALLDLGDIPAGMSASAVCMMPWVPGSYDPPSLHVVQAVVDPMNDIIESNESNNAATRSFIAGPAPDFSVSPFDMFLTGSGAAESGLASVTAWIRVANGGAQGSGQLEVSLIDENGQASPLEQVPVSLPAAMGQASELWVPVTWQTSESSVRVRATLTDISPQDYDETNGVAERVLQRKPKARPREM